MTRNLISLLGSSAAMMALLIGSVFGASATVEGYRRPEFRQLNQLILGGVMDGLIAYNQYLLAEKREPAFCLPVNLVLTVQQADDIMLRWIEKNPTPTNMPISVPLLLALRETFPCK